jgi:hypothetical protein
LSSTDECSCFPHRCVDTTKHFRDIFLFKVHRGLNDL